MAMRTPEDLMEGAAVENVASPAEEPLAETRGGSVAEGWTAGARPKAEREATAEELPLPARAPAGGVEGKEKVKAAPPAEEPLAKARDGGAAEVLAAEALVLLTGKGGAAAKEWPSLARGKAAGNVAPPAEGPLVKTRDGGESVAKMPAAGALPTGKRGATVVDAARLPGGKNSSGRAGATVEVEDGGVAE